MRKATWKIIIFIMVLMMSGPPAFSETLSGWGNITNSTSETVIDGEDTLSSSRFTRNFSLNLSKPVTPIVAYSFNLRTSLSDLEVSDYLDDTITTTYDRRVEPTLELLVRNNMYDLNTGYRRQEQWSTAHYSDSSRLTTEFYYSRLSLMPNKLPSISLDLERIKTFDHLTEYKVNDSTNSYSLASSYRLPSKDLRLGYNIVFSRDVNRTPLSIRVKSVRANFVNNYNIGYANFLWNRKIDYSVMYRGNYSRNRERQYFASTGSQLDIRDNNGGFSDIPLSNDHQVALASNSELTGGNLITTASIDLSTAINNQIGIQILFGKSVKKLYIYVDENISIDNVLNNFINWKVYKSSSNSYGSWTPVSISSVNVAFDSLNAKYRYEITFSSSEEAFYFKAVNLLVSSVGGVDVTEIQALGIDTVTSIGAVTDVSESFSQGINLSAGIRPAKRVGLSLSYSLDRADQTPTSVTDSVSGIIENIFSKSLDNEDENISSTLTRNYAASARWQAHSLLTSAMNISRNEDFNNTGEIESASNNYSISMNYVPLPVIDTNFTMIRSDSFNNSEKIATNDSLLLSADTKLHRDVNMVTDIGFSSSKSFVSDTTTYLSTINGSLDANITRKMTGAFNYGYSTTATGDNSTVTTAVSTSANYQLGRLTSFSGHMDYTKSNDNEDITGLVGVNWLPLPKIRLNADYQHKDSDGDIFTTKTDSLSSGWTIYITKFVNVRVSYAYARSDFGGLTEQETHTVNSNLNCRF